MAFEGSVIQTIASGINGILQVENVTYILADGRNVPISLYPGLYAVISGRYGEGGTDFTLPDLRGYYLRGDSLDSVRDPDLSSRVLYGPNTVTSGVGTYQPSAGLSHIHTGHSLLAPDIRRVYNPSNPQSFRTTASSGTTVTSSGLQSDQFFSPPTSSASGIDIVTGFMNPSTYTYYTYIKAT